jgi:hypothetical protein
MGARYDGCVCGSQHLPSLPMERRRVYMCVSDFVPDVRYSLRCALEMDLYCASDCGADPASGGSVIEVTP